MMASWVRTVLRSSEKRWERETHTDNERERERKKMTTWSYCITPARTQCLAHFVSCLSLHCYILNKVHTLCTQKPFRNEIQREECYTVYLHLRVVWVWSVKETLIHWNQVGESNLEDSIHLDFLTHMTGIIFICYQKAMQMLNLHLLSTAPSFSLRGQLWSVPSHRSVSGWFPVATHTIIHSEHLNDQTTECHMMKVIHTNHCV